jgi:hypothetical protein
MLATMFGFSRYPTDQTPGQAVLWWTLTPLTPGACRVWQPGEERRTATPARDVRLWTPEAERRTMIPRCGS